MGIFDKNSSSSTSTSASQTTPNAVGDASNAFGFGNISTGKYGGVDIDVTMTDHGAVVAALDSNANAIESAAKLGLNAIDAGVFQSGKAFDVASQALSASAQLSENSLLFSQDTIAKALASNSDQFKWSQQQTAQTIERAFASADKITRSDSTITMDAFMKYGAIAAVAIVAFLVWGKK